MTKAARLAHIFRSLHSGTPVTVRALEEKLEVSRATIFRDLDVLKDQLGVPIAWDAEAESFRLPEQPADRPVNFMVPGLWMDAEELYGMLTVINLAKLIDPGFVNARYHAYSGLLKRMMGRYNVTGYRIDQKIAVELPQLRQAPNGALRVIGPALMLDLKVKLQTKEGAPIENGSVVLPKRLVLRETGWILECADDPEALVRSITMDEIIDAEPVDWANSARW